MAQKISIVSETSSRAFPYLLGAMAEGEQTHFTGIAAREENMAVVLYEKGKSKPKARIPFGETGWGNLRQITVSGVDRNKMEYCLERDGIEEPDPYSRVVYGRPGFGKGYLEEKLRSGFLSEDYDWEGDRPLGRPWHETILYQLHVRGFTMDASSEVTSRGTFAGLTEKIPYLQELGITAVELMPAYDFDENGSGNRINFWGYTDGFYLAPKSAYCDPALDQPCDVQFKNMVKAMHRAGLEVLMQFCFFPGTSQEFVTQVLRFWAMEYHVDGFRVMGHFHEESILQDSVLAGRKVLHDHWENVSTATLPGRLDYGFVENMRRLLRGDEEQIQGLDWHLRHCPPACPPVHWIADYSGFTLKDLVSYERKHNDSNGESNWDGKWQNYSSNYGKEGPAGEESLRRLRLKQRMNALVLVFLAQGVPLLQAGDEMGHTKDGNNNSWCHDNAINWLHWNITDEDEWQFWIFVKNLIAFRKTHGVFHQSAELRSSDYRSLGMPDVSVHGTHAWFPQYEPYCRQLGILYNGAYAADQSFYVLFNFQNEEQRFELPKAPGNGMWCRKMDTGIADENGAVWPEEENVIPNEKGTVTLTPRSIQILMEKEVVCEESKE